MVSLGAPAREIGRSVERGIDLPSKAGFDCSERGEEILVAHRLGHDKHVDVAARGVGSLRNRSIYERERDLL